MDATKDKKPQQEGGRAAVWGHSVRKVHRGWEPRARPGGSAQPGHSCRCRKVRVQAPGSPAGSSSFIFLWSLANATQRLLSLSLKRTQEHGAVSSVGQKWDFLLCFSLPAPRAPDRALSHWGGDDNSATSWGLRKTTGTSSHAARGRAPGS